MEQKSKDSIKVNCIVCGEVIIGKITKEMCQRCYNKKWRKENPEKCRAFGKEWREKNLEKVRANNRRWKIENSEKVKISAKKYREENSEKLKIYRRIYCQNNSEKLKIKNAKWQKENPLKANAKTKRWQQKNQEKIKIYRRIYCQKNSEKLKIRSAKWREKNSEKVKAATENWQKANPDKIKDYKNKPDIKIKSKLNRRLNHALTLYTNEGKIKKANEYGINYKAIIEHLKPFPKDRSKYHIDHIRPLCSFNFINKDGTQNLEEIKKAFAPKNHQWLLAFDNISKGGRWGIKEQVRYLFI